MDVANDAARRATIAAFDLLNDTILSLLLLCCMFTWIVINCTSLMIACSMFASDEN